MHIEMYPRHKHRLTKLTGASSETSGLNCNTDSVSDRHVV